jgi:hypothetical protein
MSRLATEVADMGMRSLPAFLQTRVYIIGIHERMKDVTACSQRGDENGVARHEEYVFRIIHYVTADITDPSSIEPLLVEIALDNGKPRREVAMVVMDHFAKRYRSAGLAMVLTLVEPNDSRNVKHAYDLIAEYADQQTLYAAIVYHRKHKSKFDENLNLHIEGYLSFAKERLANPPKPAPLRAGAKDVVAKR